jgi:hypothetical protein
LFGDVDPNRFLYHYTTSERALDLILPQQRLRFNLLQATNDPREAKDWFFNVRQRSDPVGDEFLSIVSEATRLAKATTRVLCLTRDDPVSSSTPPTNVFGRGFAHSRMWAQYGGNHSGVCLIFEKAALAQAIVEEVAPYGRLHSGRVRYLDWSGGEVDAFLLDYDEIRERGLDAVVQRQVEQHHRVFFFQKNSDWANEWEYRWILVSPVEDEVFVSINASLRGVCIGPDFSVEDLDRMREACQPLSVEAIARCVWRNGWPVIVPTEGEALSLEGISFKATPREP